MGVDNIVSMIHAVAKMIGIRVVGKFTEPVTVKGKDDDHSVVVMSKTDFNIMMADDKVVDLDAVVERFGVEGDLN